MKTATCPFCDRTMTLADARRGGKCQNCGTSIPASAFRPAAISETVQLRRSEAKRMRRDRSLQNPSHDG